MYLNKYTPSNPQNMNMHMHGIPAPVQGSLIADKHMHAIPAPVQGSLIADKHMHECTVERVQVRVFTCACLCMEEWEWHPMASHGPVILPQKVLPAHSLPDPAGDQLIGHQLVEADNEHFPLCHHTRILLQLDGNDRPPTLARGGARAKPPCHSPRRATLSREFATGTRTSSGHTCRRPCKKPSPTACCGSCPASLLCRRHCC